MDSYDLQILLLVTSYVVNHHVSSTLHVLNDTLFLCHTNFITRFGQWFCTHVIVSPRMDQFPWYESTFIRFIVMQNSTHFKFMKTLKKFKEKELCLENSICEKSLQPPSLLTSSILLMAIKRIFHSTIYTQLQSSPKVAHKHENKVVVSCTMSKNYIVYGVESHVHYVCEGPKLYLISLRRFNFIKILKSFYIF